VGGPAITKVDASLDVFVVTAGTWMVTKFTMAEPLVSEYVMAARLKKGLAVAPVPDAAANVNAADVCDENAPVTVSVPDIVPLLAVNPASVVEPVTLSVPCTARAPPRYVPPAATYTA